MAERFNRTLLSMLSTYVQENQRDWDLHLPYILMAYRSTEHETTSFSPNMLMLGREATTPLDVMYEMPPDIKDIPASQWVWVLRERLESAHKLVRENIQGEMLRQKRYHDTKLSWSSFKPGEMVYVFFPTRKSGCSPKLTSFWRGPFLIEEKLSDVLYKVACGTKGKSTVIHCDRMRKCKAQTLQRENDVDILESENSEEYEIPEMLEVHKKEDHTEISVNKSDSVLDRPKRTRNVLTWHDDYIVEYKC